MKLQEPGHNPDEWSIELWAAILWRKLSTKWGYFLPGQLQLNREEKNKSQSGQIIVIGQKKWGTVFEKSIDDNK